MSEQDRQIGAIQQDLADVKSTMRQIAEAMTRLAVLEERHAAVAATLSRVTVRQDKLDERQSLLELEHIKAKTAANTIFTTARVLWAVAGGAVVYTMGKIWTMVR